ncbi:MAG: lycopene cyclase family protein [Gammaproteobacteria bacterium]|nr:lycopene cyclase family protein [Gammaproteobacteria bacterium]
MTSSSYSFDIAVIGGGPAGCISALLLKKQGFDIVLFDPDKSASRLEGIGNRLMHWFRVNDLETVIPDPTRVTRLANWNGNSNDYNFEFLVERKSMDASLRGHVGKQGVAVVAETADYRKVKQAVEVTAASGTGFKVKRVIDARGRKAHSGKHSIHGPATVSIGGWLDECRSEMAFAQVIPFRDGWVWAAHPGGGHAWFQATLDAVDGKSPPLSRLQQAFDSCRQQLAQPLSGDFSSILVRGCAPVIGNFTPDPQIIPVGDAAAAMDPLSGNGMFWAVSSALAASASINTLESRPGASSETLVARYLSERIGETYYRQTRLGRDFLRMETRYRDAAFWSKRLNFPDNQALHQPTEGIQVKKSIVVVDGILKEKEILITPLEPTGVAWVDGVDAIEIWSLYQSEDGIARMSDLWGEDKARSFHTWINERLAVQAPAAAPG